MRKHDREWQVERDRRARNQKDPKKKEKFLAEPHLSIPLSCLARRYFLPANASREKVMQKKNHSAPPPLFLGLTTPVSPTVNKRPRIRKGVVVRAEAREGLDRRTSCVASETGNLFFVFCPGCGLLAMIGEDWTSGSAPKNWPEDNSLAYRKALR